MISKISLGTVQFGKDYGISNTKGKVSKKEVFEILDYAKAAGINSLDTAFSYGTSEAVIGEYLRGKGADFNIISKFPSIGRDKPGNIEEVLKQSIQKLGTSSLYGYLLHQFSDVLEDNNIWDSLVHLKQSGLVEKIGFSVYSPEDLILLLEKGIDFDIIQVPYSIFDQRFDAYFPELKRKGIEVYSRSVFLQGLYFLSLDGLDCQFDSAREKLEALNRIAQESEISIQHLCLGYALLNAGIDHVIIGVDSIAQLKSDLKVEQEIDVVKNAYDQLKSLRMEDENILLPYLWKQNKELVEKNR
ncbi:MAG: aldo/keto reductase [Candidatus Omnitrophica bacterium]|nr:aldo/keto reductase [Candidatus Omnitrophota bacterium]